MRRLAGQEKENTCKRDTKARSCMSHLAFCSFSMVSLSFDAGTATDRAFLLGGLILKDQIWVPLNPV